LKGYMIKTKGF